MEQKTITLKRGQVKGIYEYFSQLLQQEGQKAEFSYLIYKNTEILDGEYKNIITKIYDETRDEKFQEFRAKNEALAKKNGDLILKYADRDEQGNPITENNNYKITEQIVEFKEETTKLQEEANKLQEEYKDVLDNRQRMIDESIKFLEMTSEYSLIVMPISNFPDKTMPAIVGIFGI